MRVPAILKVAVSKAKTAFEKCSVLAAKALTWIWRVLKCVPPPRVILFAIISGLFVEAAAIRLKIRFGNDEVTTIGDFDYRNDIPAILTGFGHVPPAIQEEAIGNAVEARANAFAVSI